MQLYIYTVQINFETCTVSVYKLVNGKKSNKQFTNKFLKMEKNGLQNRHHAQHPRGVARMVPLDIDRSHPVVGGWQRESALMRVGDMNFKVREVFQQLV